VQRRRLIAAGAVLPLVGCSVGEVQTFPTIAAAVVAIESLAQGHRHTGAWSLSQMLQHVAQSIDCSIDGYPQLRSALFRKAIGGVAFAAFQARGRMSHALDEPIPGTPALDAQLALPSAISRAQIALRRFEAHDGALAPHFAYGVLDKAEYTRAHLMHLANHWLDIERS
jgi:hypothetical protein